MCYPSGYDPPHQAEGLACGILQGQYCAKMTKGGGMFHKPLDVMFPHPPAGLDPSTLKEESVPQHVAVIMDGNGRWAKKRALNRLKGHQAGIGAVR